MKEDVLEQIVDDYLQLKGYFTTHNVRFRPHRDHPDWSKNADSVRSDVDVVGLHPRRNDLSRVVVVSCKAWQGGFDASAILTQLRGERANPVRETWKHFGELWVPKWSEAFRSKIEDLTGSSQFTYLIAVTHLSGDTAAWSSDPVIKENLPDCEVGFLTLEKMWTEILEATTTTPASSEVGRLAQLLKAARLAQAAPVHPPEA